MLAKIAAADSASTVLKRTAFLFIAKRNHTLSTLYINTRGNFVFYSIYVGILVSPFYRTHKRDV